MQKSYKAPAIKRTIRIIEYLAKCDSPKRLSDLSKELQISKSTLHGILHALVDAGWLQRDPKGRYLLQGRIWKVANGAFTEDNILHVARPFMEEMVQNLGESIFLGIRKEDKVEIIECIEGNKEVCIGAHPGVRIPLLAGALGKVFLTEMQSQEQIISYLARTSIPKFTEKSITETRDFLSEVHKARENGYALDDEEYIRGVRAIAVPVNKNNKITAVLWVAGFSSQLSQGLLDTARKELVRAATIISKLISRRVPDLEISTNLQKPADF